MPKQEWGTKRICPTTGKRFYDLNRVPVVSPYTGEVVDIESARRKMAAAVISGMLSAALGATSVSAVEIRDGLKLGDKVVVAGTENFENAARVSLN